MDSSRQNEPSHLFLVRLWWVEDRGGVYSWHGKVQQVITVRVGSFDNQDSVNYSLNKSGAFP